MHNSVYFMKSDVGSLLYEVFISAPLTLLQLKREGGKFLLKGGPLEDAIMTSIVAMNEPKTCSTTTLRKFLLETNQDSMEYRVGKTCSLTLLRETLLWQDVNTDLQLQERSR